MGLRGLGPGLARKLVEGGLVRSPADLYPLRVEDLTPLNGVGETTAQRLVQSIAASRAVPLWRVIVGLGVPGVGPQRARELARGGSSLAAWLDGGPGEEVTAWLDDASTRAWVQRLADEGLGRAAESAE